MQMYDEEWAKRFDELADAAIPGRIGLFRIAAACFAGLPAAARVLVAGCGTGTEILHLASRNPGWQFEAVDPAEPMVAVCRKRLTAQGLTDRVRVHVGTMGDLRIEPCHGATAILVSQHLVEDSEAAEFFSSIASNLVPGGLLYSADISLPQDEASRETMLRLWKEQGIAEGVPSEGLASMRTRFGRDLAPRAPDQIRDLLHGAGFESSLQLFQSLIYRAWHSQKHGRRSQ